MTAHNVGVRRVYDEPGPTDGSRVLVDRIWPRGLSKEKAHLNQWCKAVAPSTDLRKWYAHVPERFVEFTTRYEEELKEPERAAALQRLREILREGPVTLLTATKSPEISEATVLAKILTDGSTLQPEQ